ncbi:hypothetical protein CONPUDRAFT_164953 [Coniophora puteana RWD-64-598 SS2]|uniref:DH domain-containing protein n=1 Tax=Coniophora puteana (strain RWD-64-598) TaxID=741705 RepID=A0A5M3MUE3_CONPW|nr:uncharacterized protein CONPUDRAFT_164953 [Coniophora puteana RWD-64-598 SS2]EIW82335.1 hypothetical protein CONPUDRAFT_164953 [Coniophora puteana RWD-64-598 SS2]
MSMALSSSPRKIVPLATGDEILPNKRTTPAVIKRVFYCGVVVEGADNGRRLPEDIQDLVLSLGEPIVGNANNAILQSDSEPSSQQSQDGPYQRKRTLTDTSALADVVNELINTERSYVKRLRILKNDYADPLRQFSRNKSTAILPPYEAKTLFGNIDSLMPVNEAFLADLEKAYANSGLKNIGDVALHHFKELRGFEHYKQYYVKREEAQSIFEREVMKKSSGFSAFIDRIKYSAADTRNRIGLRELLMDPVQRIPRYTLLFRTMIKYIAPDDPQRAKLVEADEIASKIALAETDEQTKRAAIMYSLGATVDDFPPGLISNSRRFIDCIDVEDVLDVGSSSSASASGSLHCTLFLFDDKLMIAKRPSNEKSGRVLAGLSEVDKLAKSGGIPLGVKKSGLSCKGVIDLADLTVADVGDADFHMYLEESPQDQGDRWSGRPFRSYSVEFPPSPPNLDPVRTAVEKQRFLENLWIAQAKFRTRASQSVVLAADETEVENRGGKTTYARTYFNVYHRTAFLQEPKKTKIVLHIDHLGTADPIPFGMSGPPFVIVRVHPMAGEISRYTVTSNDQNDEGEEDIVQTARIPGRIIQTIHQYGLFRFRPGNSSVPGTPTAATRSRAHIFGLDVISRNLFGSRPGSSKGDFGSVSGHHRSKSSVSRSSTYTQTTTTDGSIAKFSSRSGSIATAATSMGSQEEESSGSKSLRRKLTKRGRSNSATSPPRSRTQSLSRSASQERLQPLRNEDDDIVLQLDKSDHDLSVRLELARQNSQNQHARHATSMSFEGRYEETIFEEEPPPPIRPTSRASNMSEMTRHHSPTPASSNVDLLRSTQSPEPRRFGPRSPSPLPSRSPRSIPASPEDVSASWDAQDNSFMSNSDVDTEPLTPLPRSSRQPFSQMTALDGSQTSVVEPLSIKKKTYMSLSRSPKKNFTRTSPSSKVPSRVVSPRKVSPQVRLTRAAAPSRVANHEGAQRLLQLASITREDIESSHRAIKRVKVEAETLKISPLERPVSPPGRASPFLQRPKTPNAASAPITREAQQRLEEMRQLIGKRQQDGTPRNRRSILDGRASSPAFESPGGSDTSRIDETISEADRGLAVVISNYGVLQSSIDEVTDELKERLQEMDKIRMELQNTKRQCELMKSLLADATAEKEIMYEAFNEELDAMFTDVNLPHEEAWEALTMDLRRAKESRNALSRENSDLKRRLAEVEADKEEWSALLRSQGILS